MRVAVIGCGLVGAAVARELQLRSAQVVLYEAVGPGRGTSATTFAWVNSSDKRPRAYHDLNVAGILAHRELQAGEASGARWFFQTGNIVWAEEHDAVALLEGRCRQLAAWDYPVTRLTPGRARELEPDLVLPDGATVVDLPLEGHVLPAVLLGRLLGEAVDRGAELRSPAAVVSVTTDAAAGAVVRLEEGGADTFDAVVSCAGRWSGAVAACAGRNLPMDESAAPGSATLGYLAYTGPVPARLQRVVTSPHLNVRPDGGGRLVLQALDLDHAADPGAGAEATGPLGEEFRRRLAGVLRRCDGAVPVEIRVGQRALPADGLSVAGHLGDGERFYVVATHSGVTLAPLLGRLAAEEVLGLARHARLEPFRPERLTAAAQ